MEKKHKAVIGFSRMEKKYEWKDHVIFMGLLLGLAVFLNRHVKIEGLYMDDLYLWSCYGEQSFLEYVLPVGSTRFRFIYYLAAWLEMAFVGNHVGWFVPINIMLNAAVAWTVYFMARRLARAKAVGFFAGFLYLLSRFSYYQIGQVLGLMETMALWLAIVILWYLLCFLREKRAGQFYLCCVLYFCLCFVHERYMALFPLLLLALLLAGSRRPGQWAAAAGSFAAVQLIRLAVIGSVLPAGSGRTQVADTFNIPEALGHVIDQLGYLFGFNLGPEHLSGIPWSDTPLRIRLLVLLADLLLLFLVCGFLYKLVRAAKERRRAMLAVSALFICFMGACIAAACVTIRVEMRWIYATYTAALLFVAYMYGELTAGVGAEFYLRRLWPWGAVLAAYLLLMLPAELFYRSYYPQIYFWPEQTRYNSLAEVTYGKYGEAMQGKTVYVLGNSFGVSDFTARTFFKVFQKDRTAELTHMVFIDSIEDMGLVDSNTLVLREDPDYNCYVDVTGAVRDVKVHVKSGYYYKDNWMDEHGELTVMAGAQGLINLEIRFPGTMEGGEMITITQDEGEPQQIPLTSSVVNYQVKAEPWQLVDLKFDYNFYMQNAGEQRGKDRLAALVFIGVE